VVTRHSWAAVESVAAKIGCTPQTLLSWVRRYIPPAEAEANYYRQLAEQAKSAACT